MASVSSRVQGISLKLLAIGRDVPLAFLRRWWHHLNRSTHKWDLALLNTPAWAAGKLWGHYTSQTASVRTHICQYFLRWMQFTGHSHQPFWPAKNHSSGLCRRNGGLRPSIPSVLACAGEDRHPSWSVRSASGSRYRITVTRLFSGRLLPRYTTGIRRDV